MCDTIERYLSKHRNKTASSPSSFFAANLLTSIKESTSRVSLTTCREANLRCSLIFGSEAKAKQSWIGAAIKVRGVPVFHVGELEAFQNLQTIKKSTYLIHVMHC